VNKEPRALIIGVTGQDGSYLARLLLGKGYTVHGTSRDPSVAQLNGLAALGVLPNLTVHSVSPASCELLLRVIESVAPNEIYNLSGQSSVALSFRQPLSTLESIVSATANVLEAIRKTGAATRFYNAGSSESFGDIGEKPADETTAFRPKSPYGVAKAAAISLVDVYRNSYGLYACSGLLFNHESPLRPPHFVTRKITAAAVRIASGSRERLTLGNLAVRRDWGWAPDYVDAMWRMLQRDSPEDFVIASGESHTLEEFVAIAFEMVNLDWREHVDFDPLLSRPNDIACSLGDPGKAHRLLDWRSQISLREIVRRMVLAEQDGAASISRCIPNQI
jgi:GDPmannose 4,6-dehydratase